MSTAEDKPKTSETLTLKVPFEYQGEMVTEVTLRRPKMKDLKKTAAARGTDADKSATMIAALTGWSPSQVDELDAADIDEISKVIDSFS